MLVISVATACGSTPERDGGAGADEAITREEIESVEASDAYRVIEKLRPLWLRDRGATSVSTPGPQLPDVAIDGVILSGGLSNLKELHAMEVRSIRYLPPGKASVRYGMDRVGGVIEVTTLK